jgi:hypothetical protein
MKGLLVYFVLGVPRAFAESGSGGISLSDPLGNRGFQDLVIAVQRGLFTIATPILAIMVIWGGIQMMVSGGNEEKFKEGRKIIEYAIIGFAVMLLATSVVYILQDFLGIK